MCRRRDLVEVWRVQRSVALPITSTPPRKECSERLVHDVVHLLTATTLRIRDRARRDDRQHRRVAGRSLYCPI